LLIGYEKIKKSDYKKSDYLGWLSEFKEMEIMNLRFFAIFSLVFCLQCSPPIITRDDNLNRILRGVGDINNNDSFTNCKGVECCSEDKECVYECDGLFSKSHNKIRKLCKGLSQETVRKLKSLIILLSTPDLRDLFRVSPNPGLRLLLALDYQSWVRIINSYTVSEAQNVLIWLANNSSVTDELSLLSKRDRVASNEIIHALLTSAGDRNVSGSVEIGLSQKINFEQSFFQLLIENANYELLQMTHNMIKEQLCSVKYFGGGQSELCMLRVYCKKKKNLSSVYVHSTELRNEISRHIIDKELFEYIADDILFSGSGLEVTDLRMTDGVCDIACADSNRGCE